MYPIRQIIAFVLSILQIAFPFAVDWFTGGGERLMYDWSPDLAFGESHYATIAKTPGQDFTVLNLTDIQIYDDELYGDSETARNSIALIKRLIEDVKPDLITISGDSFCSTLSTIALVDLFDSYGIPWAPVFGNHDGGKVGEWVFWGAWRMYRAKHSLFEFGPKDMGYGNYIINLTENGDVIHSFYLMDTHNLMREYTVNGVSVYGRDHLFENQIAWYEWAVLGNERLAGHPVQSTVIMHIPPYEYLPAWRSVATSDVSEDAPLGTLDPACASIASGQCGESGGHPPVTNGFFDKVKALGSTKDIIVGHNHLNDYSVLYEGVRLSYGLHTGFGCYYRDDLLGGTVYTVDSEGKTSIRNVYYSFVNGEWLAR